MKQVHNVMAPKRWSTKHDDNAHTEEESCASLKKLFALRSRGRACMRQLEGQAMMLIEELISEGGKSVHNVVRLETCQKSREKQTYVNELNEKVLEMCPNELIEQEVDEAAEWNFRIDEILAKIQAYQDGRFAQPIASGDRRESPQDNPTLAMNAQNEESENDLNSSGISTGSASIRLPKITLPHCNGDIARFMAF